MQQGGKERIADVRGTRGGRVSLLVRGTFTDTEAQVLARLIEACAMRVRDKKKCSPPVAERLEDRGEGNAT